MFHWLVREARKIDIAEMVLDLQTGNQPAPVSLFAGAHANAVSKGSETPQDVLLFAGGPVWGLDWLPFAPDADGAEPATQFLVVSFLPGSFKT